jgi:GDP-L-fucose synthase
MPTNLYGSNDNYDLNNSHVLPALLRKFHEAKINDQSQVTVWGSGTPRREFLHADDMADACVFLMKNYSEEGLINIGVGDDLSIKELAEMIKDITQYKGKIVFDLSKPDGTPRKLMDVSKLSALGWKASISLKEGIGQVYNEKFLSAIKN